MEKCYKFRLYPNTKQEVQIQQTFGCCRFVYNYYLAKRKKAYEVDKSTFNFVACCADLTQLKKSLEWLKETDSVALCSSLRDLDTAYQNFFRGRKHDGNIGYPKFKNKYNRHRAYRTRMTINVFDKMIQLPKLGFVECRVSKKIEGRILSATVSQTPSGKYFVSICCTDIDINPLLKTEAIVGIDLGIKNFVTTSDGQKFKNHKHLTKSEKKLKQFQRNLSRKQKGSNNRNKARIKVAQQHEKIANQRNDALHKLSTQFVNNYDVIALETLALSKMVKHNKLAKVINDASWGEFVRQLKYKATWYGKEIIQVDQFYPSSQICSECGYQNKDAKNLAVRSWICPMCNSVHDRDINAAKNILNEGFLLTHALTCSKKET